MERLRRKQWGTMHRLVRVRLVIFILGFGLAELSAQQPSTAPFSLHSDTHAFLQDRPEMPHRIRMHPGKGPWLMVAIMGLLGAVGYHFLFSRSTPAEGADVEPSWHAHR